MNPINLDNKLQIDERILWQYILKKKEKVKISYFVTNKRIIDNFFRGRFEFPDNPPIKLIELSKNFIAVNMDIIEEIHIEYSKKYFDLSFFFKIYDKGFFLPFEYITIDEINKIRAVLTDFLPFKFEESETNNLEYYMRID